MRERESRTFVSLFCGSCAIESKINADIKICNDSHPYLIEMWKKLQNGWIPPSIITEEEYKYIKQNKDENKALAGFVGFGCSFGGKWFGGIARNKKGDNYCARAEKSVLKDLEGLKNTIFTCLDYQEVEIPKNSMIYCDPPYNGTTGYSTGKFDSDKFWNYVRELSKSHIVLISEENAPNDFEVIWEKDFKRMLDVNKDNIFTRKEKLWRIKNI